MARKREENSKVTMDMTPMIDVVFQLLIFFLFTFNVVPEEREYSMNMLAQAAGSTPRPDDIDEPPIEIALMSSGAGQLDDIRLGERSLGSKPDSLRDALRADFVGNSKDTSSLKVRLDAQRQLRYVYLIRAMNAITQAGIKNVNFVDPSDSKINR